MPFNGASSKSFVWPTVWNVSGRGRRGSRGRILLRAQFRNAAGRQQRPKAAPAQTVMKSICAHTLRLLVRL
jgi:hypothetical protein